MKSVLQQKVQNQEPNLYIFLAFPILFSFLLTFVISRLIGYLITYGRFPHLYFEASPGIQIHHFTYGFFVLAAAGYLALIFSGPKAKYYISLLFGMGLGLAFDEFGMWLKLRDDEPTRWSYDGFIVVILIFFSILFAKPGIKTLFKLIPRRKTFSKNL